MSARDSTAAAPPRKAENCAAVADVSKATEVVKVDELAEVVWVVEVAEVAVVAEETGPAPGGDGRAAAAATHAAGETLRIEGSCMARGFGTTKGCRSRWYVCCRRC